MIRGLSGSLLSHEALERSLGDPLFGRMDDAARRTVRTRLRRWHVPLRAQLGPATSARGCFDRLAVPLFAQLGYRVVPRDTIQGSFAALLESDGRPTAVALVTPWGADPGSTWRDAVRLGIAHDVSWAFCLVGPVLRLFDSRRTYSRGYVEFALEETLDDDRAFQVFWGLLNAAAMRPGAEHRRSSIERAVELSEQHRSAVRGSLQHGVHQSLVHLIRAFRGATAHRKVLQGERSEMPGQRAFDESLTIIYRILFLLFAEARGLVPCWHPVYADSYTIEAIRRPIELFPRPRGLWETLQAISRLAHKGCRIGALQVPPFNGRLFSPVASPLADTVPLDDGDVRQAVLALTTRPGSSGRIAITYGDLGVEQLGSIYERLLDFEAAPPDASSGARPALRRAERRKITGSFYTPRSVTDYLVRRSLTPLVRDASAESILALRVLDPAMGSGAFLVSACRFLAEAYESAVVREGSLAPEDVTDSERVRFRRTVAQQCLYGVDVNPMAVQIGRLSIWLATLAADRPLTFLDHHLRVGNSVAGASAAELGRTPSWRSGRAACETVLPLFDDATGGAIGEAVSVRESIATGPGETLDQVHSKERALAALDDASMIACWKQVADLWCSIWFAGPSARRALSKAFTSLSDALLGRRCSLPAALVDTLLDNVRTTARRASFFHWSLEFPEVFFDARGRALPSAGFDVVIGNPPWEMLRGDRGDQDARASARSDASQLTAFARRSGVYRFQGNGHANLYQLFLERAVSLLAPGGRLGLVLPAGFAVDHGSARLRQAIFDRVSVDSIVSVENRDGLFPIHRGLKFLLLSGTKSGPTSTFPCRFGIRTPDALDALPDCGVDGSAIPLSRALVDRVGGPGLALPDIRGGTDLEIASRIAFGIPALGDPEGWHLRFGRELNATDDRQHFVPADEKGLGVVEGKHLEPFTVNLDGVRYRIPHRIAARLVNPARTFRRPRLAYRDVAAATNRLSLIAAVLPAGCITTHTVFCLKDDPGEDVQQYLCGIFNSFVANYLVRLRISTHVSASVIDRLPVPRLERADRRFREVAALARHLAGESADKRAHARIQALAARLYGLTRAHYAHVLATFPLVSSSERAAAISAFCDIVV